MRIFCFLLTLLVILGAGVLAYLGFTETLPFVEYMLASTGLSAVLALLWGHFMFTSWRNRRRAKEAERLTRALEDEKREIAAHRTSLESQLAQQAQRPMPAENLDPELTQKIMMSPPPMDNTQRL